MNSYPTSHLQVDLLSLDNPFYQKSIMTVFNMLGSTDELSDDVTTQATGVNKKDVFAVITAKQTGTLAGIAELQYCFNSTNTTMDFEWYHQDGDVINKGEVLVSIKGKAQEILAYERTILNWLQRLSGIATKTTQLKALMSNSKVLLCPTRKTLWGPLDKKAVFVAGSGTHRINLKSGILVKENHIAAAGSLSNAVTNVAQYLTHFPQPDLVEFEVEDITQIDEVLTLTKVSKTLTIMLDNFNLVHAKKAIDKIRESHPQVVIECSGGINEHNLNQYAQLNPDVISLGMLTNAAHSLDLSLRIA